jgi:hypothetical protein
MRNSTEKHKGFVLVVVAGILIALIGFVALGVDTGVLYSARTSAQEAADAGALAAAFTFVTNPQTQPATAIAHGKAAAMANTIMGQPILDTDVTVTVDAPSGDGRYYRVRVDVTKTQQTFFAKALGVTNAAIAVRAKAEAGLNASVNVNPKPFFLPNTVASSLDACAACAAGGAPGEVLIDPATRLRTAFGTAVMNAAQQLSIKPTDPSDALQPSIFFLIDFNGGGGGAMELNGWIDGSIPVPPVACGTMIEVEKGNKVGLKHGIDDLLGDPPDDLYDGMPGDTGHYLINGSVPSNTSKALVSVPIWDTCGSGFCGSGIPKVGGHQQVAVLGYALMFLEGMGGPGGDALIGRLINITGCGSGGTQPTGSSVYGFPLRLVREP